MTEVNYINTPVEFTVEDIREAIDRGGNIYQQRVDAMQLEIKRRRIVEHERARAGLPPLTAGLPGLFSPIEGKP